MERVLTPGRETVGNGMNVRFAELIALDKIKPHPEFQNLFPFNQINCDKIVERMRKSGYDSSQPLQLWETEGGLILIDGHHRRAAVRAVGITVVPCYTHRFKDIEEALEYAISLQTERRNLSDAELSRMIEKVDALKKRGRGKSGGGKSVARTAELLHTSVSRVERHRFVCKYGDEGQKARLASDEATLNEIYQEIVAQRASVESEAKKPKKDAGRVFLERAALVLSGAGDERGVDLLIEAFLPEDEREAFKTSLRQGETA
jgi:ParB family chromosome partitioning protein